MEKKPTYEDFIRRMGASEKVEHELERGMQYHHAGQLEKAEEIYRKILEVAPDDTRALHLLGVVADQVGKTETAIRLITKAIEHGPEDPSCFNDLGNAFVNHGNPQEALSCFRKALKLNPNLAGAHNNMGHVLVKQGRIAEAVSCYKKALAVKPDYAEAFMGLGIALVRQYNMSEAIPCFQKAAELKPDCAEAYAYMGMAFKHYGKVNEAIASYRKSLEIKPDFAEVYGELFHQYQRTCAWQELEGLSSKLDGLTQEALETGTRVPETPFVSLARHGDPSRNLAVARSWSTEIVRAVSTSRADFSFEDRISSRRKVVIGYLSGDIRNHPVAHAMLSLFGVHDRTKFKVYCYSYGMDDGSQYRKRIEKDSDRFIVFGELGHIDAARRIYADHVDILVDLTGHTWGNRMEICALRPAPVQVSYLGFPGTTGASFIDYLITDRIVTPEDHAPYYSEKFVYMPHSYMVTHPSRGISDKKLKKQDLGFSQDDFVFCSFNQPYKIDAITFAAWMKILRQVPKGVLWLRQMNKAARNNLRREAEKGGIRKQRLVFAEKTPTEEEHLARLGLADLALDTISYNGHVTTTDALWTEVPVITLQGSHFASRASSSMLMAIGLPELITHSLEAYEALAVRLAQNPDDLVRVRQKLARNRLSEPLFDTARFAGNLERAFKEVWRVFVAGEKPRQIKVTET